MSDPSACPVCGHTFRRQDELAETQGKCPQCGVILRLLSPEELAGKKGGSPAASRPPASGGVTAMPSPHVDRPDAGPPTTGGGRLRVPPWVWAAMAVVGLVTIVGVRIYLASGRDAPTEVAGKEGQPPAQEPGPIQKPQPDTDASADRETSVGERPDDDGPAAKTVEPAGPKVARSLEEVLEAIVKFEVPVAGQARMQFGCGFLVDGRGWIATNFHLVGRATTAARVTFADGTKCKLAGIVARSPRHDLAVVKIENPPPKLTILDVSYADTPRLGQHVYAFGHPYNADFSLSKGIVSRVLTTADFLSGSRPHIVAGMKAPKDLIWIQHDAKISLGNSGGPLLGDDGRVVGINTFVNVKAEFGYASHVRYLRELLATASEEVTPLPQAKQIVVSTKRMRELFDAGTGFRWTPQQPEQYRTLAELARQMTLAKHLQTVPDTVKASPQAVQGMIGLADQLFQKLRGAGWGPAQSAAINRYAAEGVDKVGEGTVVFTTVVAAVGNSLLLKIQDTEKHVLVPVGPQLSKSPRGTRWIVIGIVSPQVARLNVRTQPDPQRLPIVLTHYMLRVQSPARINEDRSK